MMDDSMPEAVVDADDAAAVAAPATSLEDALARTETAADAALTAAAQLTRALRRLRASAQAGNLRDLRAAIATAETAAVRADAETRAAAASWQLDEDAYFASGRFAEELLDAARAGGLQLFERDERLYSYPVLVRVVPAERSVFIDRSRERRIRPSVLIEHLREIQGRPPRFRPEAFLESLFVAYGYLARRQGADQLDGHYTARLVEVYELLTLMPGAARDYSRQEFARDLYLLDRSGVTTTRRGYTVSFPSSTGARSPAASLRVVTESGQEKVYYGIAFTRTAE